MVIPIWLALIALIIIAFVIILIALALMGLDFLIGLFSQII